MQDLGYMGNIVKDRWIAASAFLISFIVYLITLCPTVYVEGSGELISAAHLLGIAHPTGYPLFCLLVRIFSAVIPVDNVAFKVNLTSAFLASLTVVVLYLFLVRILPSKAAALGASLIFAFSSAFWSQATIAEVYSLNALFMAVLLLLLVIWDEEGEERYLLLMAFVYGLALTNHLTISLLAPGILIFILVGRRDALRNWRNLTLMGLFFLLGTSLYLYLPVRAAADPAFKWVNLKTFGDFADHITGRQYRSYLFGYPWREVLRNLAQYGSIMSKQFTPYLLWLPVLGLAVNMKKDKKMFFLLLIAFLLNIFYGINYRIDRTEIDPFFLLSFLVLAVWTGYGLAFLLDRAYGYYKGELRVLLGRASSAAAVLLPMVITLGSNFYKSDLSENWIAYNYGMDILRPLRPNAILFTQGDDASYILDYLKVIENVRPDVSLYHREGLISADIYGPDYHKLSPSEQEARRLRAEREAIEKSGRTVYYVFRTNLSFAPGYRFVPEGLSYRVEKKEGERKLKDDFWEGCDPDSIDVLPIYKDAWIRKIAANYHFSKAEFHIAQGDSAQGFEELEKASAIAFDSKWMHHNIGTFYSLQDRLEEARREFGMAISIDPQMAVAHRGLGQVYTRLGQYDKAIDSYRKAIKIRPSFSGALYGLGLVYAMKGDYRAAERYWRETLRLSPSHRGARENLRRLRMSRGWPRSRAPL